MKDKYKYLVMEKTLTELLDLQRLPVGIKFLKTEAEYKAAEAAEPEFGLPYCVAVEKAGESVLKKASGQHKSKIRERKAYKLDADHNRCAAASYAFGMLPADEYRTSGKLHADLKVYRDVEVSRSVAMDMVYCGEKNFGVLIKPLGSFTDEGPDMTVLILTPKQAMRLIQGYAYNYGQLKNIKMAGMCAVCQECTSYPFVKDQLNISMLCSGTRCIGRWNENELGAGIPARFIEGVIDGIGKTVNPMENRENKEKLIRRLETSGLETPEIDMSYNYYNRAYGIPKKRRD